MIRSPNTLLLISSALLITAIGSTARADVENHAQQYIQRNGFQLKQITRQVGNRNIRRIFVPVSEQTVGEFFNTFGGQKCVVLHARPGDGNEPWHHYVRLAFNPGEVWASAYDDSLGPRAAEQNNANALRPAPGTRLVVCKVGQRAKQNLRSFLNTFHRDNHYDQDIANYHTTLANEGRPSGDTSADCMWWLTNIETATGTNLMQTAGVRRTRGPQEIPALLMHSAKNEHVQIVGVGVDHNNPGIDHMSEGELFGPEPTNGGGAAGAIR